jgi:hypothetical protein
LEVNPNIFIGGKYRTAPMRHRNSNKETLIDFLRTRNILLSEDQLNCDVFVAVDHDINDEKILSLRNKSGKKNILLRSEPSCVLPEGYQPRSTNLYDRIITFGYPSGKDTSHWPQYWDEGALTNLKSNRIEERVVVINANKLNLYSSERYTLRREALVALPQLDLFGEGWNQSLKSRLKTLIIEMLKQPLAVSLKNLSHARRWFQSWPKTQAPENKEVILQKYKISLVIENDSSYLSEKLFDAITSGCIPVYVGPRVEQFKIPTSLVVEAKPDLVSIKNAIDLAKNLNHAEFLTNARNWLSLNETIENHRGDHVMERVFKSIISEF